jgi:hypothetical protein
MEHDIFLFKCSYVIISLFIQELQKGFYIPACEGKSLFSFLNEDCGISEEYISGSIKTVLIDGGPVDDIFNTKIKDGGGCALSGAMPGIVGAMMRIGSPYAPMRESITVKPEKTDLSGKLINYELKLFNIVLSDMGLLLLKKGILLKKERIYDLFTKHHNDIYSNCSKIFLNGKLVSRQKETGIDIDKDKISGLVILKIELEDENKS